MIDTLRPAEEQESEEEMDVIAFELWQRSCRQDPAASEDCSDDEEAVGVHSSCL